MQTLIDLVTKTTKDTLEEHKFDYDFSIAISNKEQPEILIYLKLKDQTDFENNKQDRITQHVNIQNTSYLLRLIPTYTLVRFRKKLIETLAKIIVLNLEG
nr:MAG TPA: hypothetical protein [Bacteriophage sp.]